MWNNFYTRKLRMIYILWYTATVKGFRGISLKTLHRHFTVTAHNARRPVVAHFRLTRTMRRVLLLRGVGWGVNQAYSRLSTTHGYITDCKLDLVAYVGVCV